MGNVAEPELIRIALGELDDGRRQREDAWTIYLQIAASIAPEVMDSLLTPEAFALYRAQRVPGYIPPIYGPAEKYIAAWCERWGFLFRFAWIPANNTLVDASNSDEPMPTNFVSDVHGNGPGFSLAIGAQSVSRDGGKTWEEVVMGKALSIKLPTLSYAPDRETKLIARTRIMKAIGRLIDAELDAIEAEYRRMDYVPVRESRQLKHFEWLARYQLRVENKQAIANSEGVTRDAVHKAILKVADLLGIRDRLRKEPTGRPAGRRDRRARTIVVKPRNQRTSGANSQESPMDSF